MIPNSLRQDFDYILNSNVDWNKFENATFLVTGATGLLGSLLIKSLLYVSETLDLGIKIIALVRSLEKAHSVFPDTNGIEFVVHDFLSDSELYIDEKVDYIVHAAAVTASKEMISNPVENIKTSLRGTISILDYAIGKKIQGMVFLSSMEAYGRLNITDHKVKEDELGNIDLMSVRSCYPEGKRVCELICNAYASEYLVNVVTARLAQTFGPGISKSDNRIFSQISRAVIEKRDIVLKTDGFSEGNYVYTADAIVAILLLLLYGKKGQVYNVVNERNHTTIRDSANMVADKIACGNIKVVYDINDNVATGYAEPTKMWMSSEKMNQLGWEAKVSLLDMYERTIQYLDEIE